MRDYSGLITNYNCKPHFTEHVRLSTQPFNDVSSMLDGLLTSFDLDRAVGVQLDVIGEWVGVDREIVTPIQDYFFSFDTAGLGFDQGSWKDRYDSLSGYTNLDDVTYRCVIKAKIGANNWNGSAETLPAILDSLSFSSGVKVSYVDNQDMSITLVVSGKTIPLIIRSVIAGGYLAIKPVGIKVNYEFEGE